MSNFLKNVSGIEFPFSDVEEAVNNNRLLSIEIELTLQCNFRCPYCYVPDSTILPNELTYEEICSVIGQAKKLGAKKIVLLGGEPMLYPYLFEIIELIRSLEMDVEMFTNGFGITEGIAEKLFNYCVNVVLKMNSFKEGIQDELCGHKGAFTIIHDAFKNLRSAGYPSQKPFMAISSIICKQNIDEIRGFWRWIRNQKMEPYFEIITPQGKANENIWLEPDNEDLQLLFNDIQKIDSEEYGYQWNAQPPLIGKKCLRHLFSCLITSQGNVFPCVGIPISVGNIRQQKLSEIIDESEVIQNLRNYKYTIKGPCKNCEKADYCYGCRGAAYNLTGDYLGSDPTCWKNFDKQNQIEVMPCKVDDFLPHQRKMKVIDSIISVGEKCVEVETLVTKDMIFIDSKNKLNEAVFVEMIAQSIAALNGFENRNNPDAKSGGFLLGAKNLKVLGDAYVGDKLRISVFKEAKYGDFGILKGCIKNNLKVIAEGEIKIYTKFD